MRAPRRFDRRTWGGVRLVHSTGRRRFSSSFELEGRALADLLACNQGGLPSSLRFLLPRYTGDHLTQYLAHLFL